MPVFFVCVKGCSWSRVSVLRCLSVVPVRERGRKKSHHCLIPQQLYHEPSCIKDAFFVCVWINLKPDYKYETVKAKGIFIVRFTYWFSCFVVVLVVVFVKKKKIKVLTAMSAAEQ